MVTRILYLLLTLAVLMALANPAASSAAYCGPMGCPPPKVAFNGPVPAPAPMPALSMPGPVCRPAPMACMPNCAPTCAPPTCGPSTGCGFNPVSAIFSVIAFPFKLIGGIFSGRQDCRPAMCPPPCCMPMMSMPDCGPAPITKCKPAGRAAMAPGPMGY